MNVQHLEEERESSLRKWIAGPALEVRAGRASGKVT